MSKRQSKRASAPSVSTEVLSYANFIKMFKPDPIDAAIEAVTKWPAKCPGPCFPIVHRSWMSHTAFQVA